MRGLSSWGVEQIVAAAQPVKVQNECLWYSCMSALERLSGIGNGKHVPNIGWRRIGCGVAWANVQRPFEDGGWTYGYQTMASRV